MDDARDEARGHAVSIESLPPARQRPIQWKRLWQNLSVLYDGDPQRVLDAAFSVGDALGGMSEERQLIRVLESPDGQRLIAQKSSLPDALADHAALREMPAGSLGRAFLAFSERHQIDSRKLIESQHDMSRDYADLDPIRKWQNDRSTVMHDLWHVLAGYDATTAGESALMCFSLPQRVNDRALPIFIAMSVFTGKLKARNALEAVLRGRRAEHLSSMPLEELLPLPLGVARERLGIRPPKADHAGAVTAQMLIE